jgi:hypothetical protein
MKNTLPVNADFSVSTTIMKLAIVSSALLSCVYGVLMIFTTALKVFA